MTPRDCSVCRRVLSVALAGAALAAASSAFAAPSVPGLEVSGLSTMIMSLALVIGFIFAAAFVAKRMPFGLGARGNNGALKVLAALPLGPKERLLLVQAKGEELLIAVSPAGVFNVGAQAAAGTPPSAPRAANPAPAFVLRDEP
jgi:flagellar protein FliO/FliZ